MIRKDYIMKMVEDFVKVIAAVIMKRELKKYVDARYELDNLSKLVSGLGIEHLRALGSEGIAYVFGMKKESFTEKVYCSARILKEDALILNAERKTEDSLKSLKIAEELFEMVSDREFDAKDILIQDAEILKQKEFN